MRVTTHDRIVDDRGPEERRPAWLDLDGPVARTVFVGRERDEHVVGGEARPLPPDAPAAARSSRPVPTEQHRVPRRRRQVPRRRLERSRIAPSLACDSSAAPSLRGARLTRRGRVVVTVAWLVLALVAAVPIVSSSAGVEKDAPPSTVTVGVSHGDTVWDIARSADPHGDPRELVSAIIRLNGLDSVADIRAGDRLVVPIAP